MAFDRKRYNMFKKFMISIMESRPWCSNCESQVDWIKGFLPIIKECNEIENYEGSKAIKDAAMEVLNRGLPEGNKIKETDLLILD